VPPLRSTTPRFSRIALATLAAASLAAGLAVTAVPAQADLKHRIASAQAQLHALDVKAEQASERYNQARIKLASDQQQAASAQRELASAQQKLARLQRAVAAFAVAAYQGQTLDTSMGVTADSPQDYLDKLASLQAVSNSQTQALADLAGARRAEEQAQASASAALAAQRSATAQMHADRASVQAAAHQEETILHHMEAREAAIIRAAKARAARLAAERAAAALRAREAAAASAAAALSSQSVNEPVVSGSGGARVAVEWAYKELGKPYVWGAAGPNSFDCSGLTQYVWAKAGVYLDHYTGDQWNEGQHVSQSQLEPGDLVFFGSDLHHVGIYVGSGNMIEAPYTGADVRVSPYDRPDYAGAVRPGT
jgi:cell wall-associated NlpC family hydrolase